MKFRSRNSFRTELLCLIKKRSAHKPRYCMKKGKEETEGRAVKGRRGEGEREAPFHIRLHTF